MAIVRTDWEQYRDANSDIPPDIFFTVSQGSTRDDNVEIETEDETKMIGAHKLLLAGTSPVFHANFFGVMKMTGKVMVVKETTLEAFSTLLDFIYWPLGKADFTLDHITCFEKLCDIVEISERYQILDLRQLAEKTIRRLEITKQNVVQAAIVADKFKGFDDIQRRLTNRSLAFLDRTMKSSNDVISLMVEAKAAYPENGLEILLDLLNVENKQARIGNFPFIILVSS